MSNRDEIRAKLFEGRDARAQLVAEVLRVSIPAQIKALRLDRGWTQEQVAEKTGMAQSQISELESVRDDLPSIKSLRRIAIAFDVALIVKFASWPEFFEWAAGWETLAAPAPYWASAFLSDQREKAG